MTASEIGNSNGAKAFGGVAAIIAVIAGLVAMSKPMSQRIDTAMGQINRLHTRVEKGERDHTYSMTEQASIKEKFAQLNHLNLRCDELEIRLRHLERSLIGRGLALTFEERLRELERNGDL